MPLADFYPWARLPTSGTAHAFERATDEKAICGQVPWYTTWVPAPKNAPRCGHCLKRIEAGP